MAAEEQHEQRVVLVRDVALPRLERRRALPLPPRPLAAHVIDQAPLGRLDEPAARLLRDAVPRPARRRDDERLLDGVLGRGEVAVPADEHAEDLRRELAQQALDLPWDVQLMPPACCRSSSIPAMSRGASSITSRTWIGCC